jgi:hypothetical protein
MAKYCGNSGSDPNRTTSAILAGSEIRKKSSFTLCICVLRGAAHVALSHCAGVVTSLLEDEHGLSLGMLVHAKYMHEFCSLLMHILTYYNVISCYNHDLK